MRLIFSVVCLFSKSQTKYNIMNTSNNTAAQYEAQPTSILHGESIKKFADLLIDNGYKVFTTIYSHDSNPTYINYTDGINIAYAQEGRWGGVDLSTEHIPHKNTGCGYSLYQGLINPTIEHAKKGFEKAPEGTNPNELRCITKYNNLEHYLSQPLNKLGTIVFLTK